MWNVCNSKEKFTANEIKIVFWKPIWWIGASVVDGFHRMEYNEDGNFCFESLVFTIGASDRNLINHTMWKGASYTLFLVVFFHIQIMDFSFAFSHFSLSIFQLNVLCTFCHPPPPPKKTNVFNSNILRTSARCFGFILAYAHYKDSMCISRLCHRLEKIQLLKMGRFFGNLKLISRLNVKYPKKWFSVEKLLPNAHHGIVHFTQ